MTSRHVFLFLASGFLMTGSYSSSMQPWTSSEMLALNNVLRLPADTFAKGLSLGLRNMPQSCFRELVARARADSTVKKTPKDWLDWIKEYFESGDLSPQSCIYALRSQAASKIASHYLPSSSADYQQQEPLLDRHSKSDIYERYLRELADKFTRSLKIEGVKTLPVECKEALLSVVDWSIVDRSRDEVMKLIFDFFRSGKFQDGTCEHALQQNLLAVEMKKGKKKRGISLRGMYDSGLILPKTFDCDSVPLGLERHVDLLAASVRFFYDPDNPLEDYVVRNIRQQKMRTLAEFRNVYHLSPAGGDNPLKNEWFRKKFCEISTGHDRTLEQKFADIVRTFSLLPRPYHVGFWESFAPDIAKAIFEVNLDRQYDGQLTESMVREYDASFLEAGQRFLDQVVRSKRLKDMPDECKMLLAIHVRNHGDVDNLASLIEEVFRRSIFPEGSCGWLIQKKMEKRTQEEGKLLEKQLENEQKIAAREERRRRRIEKKQKTSEQKKVKREQKKQLKEQKEAEREQKRLKRKQLKEAEERLKRAERVQKKIEKEQKKIEEEQKKINLYQQRLTKLVEQQTPEKHLYNRV